MDERTPSEAVSADLSSEPPATPDAGGDEPKPSLRSRVAGGAEAVADAVAEAGEALVERFRPVAEDVAAAVDGSIVVRPAAGPVRGKRRRSRTPLPSLYDVHPEARSAPSRELGLLAIPVDEIVGSAVDGPAQRGLDFLPLPPLRSSNWETRWQRIRAAMNRLEVLPPIEVLKTAEGYWIVDGHNRVAAAKAVGQVDVDAVVRVVRLPGEPGVRPTGSLAPLLEGSDQIRAAGSGRLTPGASLGASVHDHGHEPAAPTESPGGDSASESNG